MALFDPPASAPNPAPDGETRGLRDGFGRHFSYLRISLTEKCNFRCTYCLPEGFRKQTGLAPELSRDEILRAVRGFARLGLWKFRLTGGEPTVRPDFAEILEAVAGVPGAERIALTTNGYRLAQNAKAWRESGLDAVNVSIDTLDPEGFAKITGHDRLKEVIAGIDACLDAGFDAVKVNSVLMKSLGARDWEDILAFVADRPVTWRFIELMRTNDNAGFHRGEALPGEVIRSRLLEEGWQARPRQAGAGPSNDYLHPARRGSIGLISPYASGFCDSCNRLRLSSRGKLHLCLFGDEGLDLRDLLQSDDQLDALANRIRAAMPNKMRAHRLHDGNSGQTPHLASIGG